MDKFVIRTKRETNHPSSPIKCPAVHRAQGPDRLYSSPKKPKLDHLISSDDKKSPTKIPRGLKRPYLSPKQPKCDLGDLIRHQKQVSTKTPPRPKTKESPYSSPKGVHKDILPSSEVSTIENRLDFVPLKPKPPSKEELEAESQRAIYHPLPRAFKKSEIYRGRQNVVDFSLSYPSRKKVAYYKIFNMSRKTQEEEEVSVTHSMNKFTLNRSQDQLLGLSDDVLPNWRHSVLNVSNVMADLTSHCVVLLGNSRLEEAEAKKLLNDLEKAKMKKIF